MDRDTLFKDLQEKVEQANEDLLFGKRKLDELEALKKKKKISDESLEESSKKFDEKIKYFESLVNLPKKYVKDFDLPDDVIAKFNDQREDRKSSLNKLVMQQMNQLKLFEEKKKVLMERRKKMSEIKMKHDLLYNILKIKFMENSDQRIKGVILSDSKSLPVCFDLAKNLSTTDMFWSQFK